MCGCGIHNIEIGPGGAIEIGTHTADGAAGGDQQPLLRKIFDEMAVAPTELDEITGQAPDKADMQSGGALGVESATADAVGSLDTTQWLLKTTQARQIDGLYER